MKAPNLASTVVTVDDYETNVSRPSITVASESNKGCASGMRRGLHRVDALIYPPEEMQRKLNESKTPLGGVLTIVVPVLLSVYFGIVYTKNDNLPDVSIVHLFTQQRLHNLHYLHVVLLHAMCQMLHLLLSCRWLKRRPEN
jgi:hypothetical protein